MRSRLDCQLQHDIEGMRRSRFSRIRKIMRSRQDCHLQHDIECREWSAELIKSPVLSLLKKENLQFYKHYRTVSLISYPSSDIDDYLLEIRPTSGVNHGNKASWF